MAGGRRFLALDTGKKLDDGLADLGEVGPELLEHLGGNTLAFADEAQEDVFGTDVVVAELEEPRGGQFQDLLCTRREWDVPAWCLGALADDLNDLTADGFEADPHALESTGGNALAFVNETEEDVFSADVVVVEESRLFLSKDDDPSGPIGKPFKQGNTS